MVSAARLTETDSTPSMVPTARSMRAEQDAQCIPFICACTEFMGEYPLFALSNGLLCALARALASREGGIWSDHGGEHGAGRHGHFGRAAGIGGKGCGDPGA